MTPARLLHALAGSPAMPDCARLDAPAPCWICARETMRGALVSRWMGANYCDQARARCPSSRWICEACVWCCAWNPPPRMPRGEGKGLNLRLFSHLYCERNGEPLYLAANKADKPWIRAWLATPKPAPWFCAIADSGQKHVLPWAPINLAPGVAGVVRFEERDVRIDASVLASIDATCALLTAGATKDEIEAGVYRPMTWTRLGAERIRVYEREHAARARGGGAFALVLWLAQRDEDAVAERLETERAAKVAAKEAERGRGKQRSGAEAVGGDRAGAPGRVRARGAPGLSRVGGVGADALDADRAAPPSQRADDSDGGRVGQRRRAAPPPAGGKQGSLFGDD